MSITKTSSAGNLSVECLWPGDTAPPGWTDQAEEVFKKSGQTNVFQRSLMPPDAVTAKDFPFYKLLLTDFRDSQDTISARAGERLAGELIIRSLGSANWPSLAFNRMTKEDRVKEDKKFIGQYPGKASALFDSLCTLEEALTNCMKCKAHSDFKGVTEIVEFAIEPDLDSHDPGSALLNDLGRRAGLPDPENVDVYTTRGFVEQGSYTVRIPKTEWARENTEALATWLMKRRAEAT